MIASKVFSYLGHEMYMCFQSTLAGSGLPEASHVSLWLCCNNNTRAVEEKDRRV